MYSASSVCVILLIVGNINGFSIRPRRDLEEKILALYGPPISRPTPHHPTPLKHKDMTETLPPQIPVEILTNVFGPPLNTSKPDPESQKPRFHSAIIHDTRQKEEKDLAKPHPINEAEEAAILKKDITNIFGTPSPELMVGNKTMTAPTNFSKVPLNYDDRFLSETLLRTHLLNNIQRAEEHDTRSGKSEEPDLKPRRELVSEPVSKHIISGDKQEPGRLETAPVSNPEHLGDKLIPVHPTTFENDHHIGLSNPKSVEPKNLEPKKPDTHAIPNNASKHIASNVLVIMFVYFCMKSFVLI